MGGYSDVQWGELILADLERRANGDRLLFLYVDRAVLGRLSGLAPVDAAANFCSAFRSRPPDGPFRPACERAVRWRQDGSRGAPPFLADLAMTVLAVTEAPVGGKHGVYRRQNELLGLPPEAVQPPGYGDHVPLLWQTWNSWLTGPGRALGKPTATTHSHWSLQGWARSQALVRHRDRHRIDRFFDDLGAPTGQDLVELFRTWLSYRGRDGVDLLETLDGEAEREIYQQVLEDEAGRWRAEGPRERSASGTRGLLVYDDWDETFSGAFEVTQAWHGLEVETGNGERHLVEPSDDYVRLVPEVEDGDLLERGTAVDVQPGRPVRLGGEPLYVFRDEPRLSGRVQARTSENFSSYHVLVHQSGLEPLVSAMSAVGVTLSPSTSSVEGWSWCESVVIPRDSPLLRLMGLAAALPGKSAGAALTGGLRLSGSTYLVGGEPDVVDPEPDESTVVLDGHDVRRTAGQTLTPLAVESPDPGEHRVEIGGTTLRFTTLASVRLTAHPSPLQRPVSIAGDRVRVHEATGDEVTGAWMSGALLEGVPAPLPVVVGRRTGTELLVALADGELLQVLTPEPRWLPDIDVRPNAVDVMDAVRATASPVELVIAWQPTSQRVRALAVPSDAVVPPGQATTLPRPDVVGALWSADWRWRGVPDEKAKTRILRRAMRLGRRPVAAGAAPATRLVPDQAPARRRDLRRVAAGPVANPFDDVLEWMSEQETATVGLGRFADAWAWSSRRHGMPDLMPWRLALNRLVELGHVEREHARRRVGVASAALVSLPDSSGLSVLAGARPGRMLERLDDTDDAAPAVAEAASLWELHRRTPLRLDGMPDGPTAVFVEWDPERAEVVRQGLASLGISLVGCSATALARSLPPLRIVLAEAQAFTLSPGRDVSLYVRDDARGGWSWRPRSLDTGAGLYRYRLTRGNVFAWRESQGSMLTMVDPALGKWMARSAVSRRTLLRHHARERVLLAPADLPLPGLARRVLALRTGLPPVLLRGFRPDGRGAGEDHLAWDNIDRPTADQVAAMLDQALENENGALTTEDE